MPVKRLCTPFCAPAPRYVKMSENAHPHPGVRNLFETSKPAGAKRDRSPSMSFKKQKTHTEASALPSFPSMTACSAATGIPRAVLQRAKRAGCPAFDQANRIHLGVLLPWLFRPDADDDPNVDWHARFKRAQALEMEANLEERRGGLVPATMVVSAIQKAAGELNSSRIQSEAEHPTRFAAANGDVAQCRTIIRGIWDEVFRCVKSVSKNLSTKDHEKTETK
jgi:hypothetical protein